LVGVGRRRLGGCWLGGDEGGGAFEEIVEDLDFEGIEHMTA
jgi:hypothetical protein